MNTQLDIFEAALLTELREHVSNRAPQRRPGRRWAAGILAAAAVAGAFFATGIGGGPAATPAYAVQVDDDGSVVVTIHALEDAAGLESALADQGIDADVSYGQMPAGAVHPLTPDSDGVPEHGHLWRTGMSTEGLDLEDPTVEMDGDEECGFIEGAPDPATIAREGDDWVMRIPATSPMQERHVYIGTFDAGALSAQYGGTDPRFTCSVITVALQTSPPPPRRCRAASQRGPARHRSVAGH
jgi:hypothetical protein